MKLKFMRLVDFWIGIPCCFLLSCYKTCAQIANPQRIATQSPVKKILLVKLSEMGTITLTYPLLDKLKKRYPDVQLCFLVFNKNAPALNLLDGLVEDKNIYKIEDSSFIQMVITTFETLQNIRKAGFDVVIDLEFFSRFTAILTYLTGAPKRVGFFRYYLEGLYRGNFLTHKIEYNSSLHCSHAYLSLGEELEKTHKDTPELKSPVNDDDLRILRFASTAEGQRQARSKLESQGYQSGQQLFLINPGEGTLSLREWPFENFLELAQRILKDPNHMIAIVGSDFLSKKDELLFKNINHSQCINLVGQTTIYELLEIFHIASVLITNDCGLAHLASLTPIEKFIFFGPGSPHVWKPLGGNSQIIHSNLPCSPCLTVLNHRNSSCRDNQCLKIISVDSVYDLIMQSKIFKPNPYQE